MEDFPSELKLALLQASSASLQTMLALASTSPSYHAVFRYNEKTLLVQHLCSTASKAETTVVLMLANTPLPWNLDDTSRQPFLDRFENTPPKPPNPLSVASYQSIAVARIAIRISRSYATYKQSIIDNITTDFAQQSPGVSMYCQNPESYAKTYLVDIYRERLWAIKCGIRSYEELLKAIDILVDGGHDAEADASEHKISAWVDTALEEVEVGSDDGKESWCALYEELDYFNNCGELDWESSDEKLAMERGLHMIGL